MPSVDCQIVPNSVKPQPEIRALGGWYVWVGVAFLYNTLIEGDTIAFCSQWSACPCIESSIVSFCAVEYFVTDCDSFFEVAVSICVAQD